MVVTSFLSFFESIYQSFNNFKKSLIREFWEFIRVRKRYWLIPIIILLLLLGIFIVFTETSTVAPFIYALF